MSRYYRTPIIMILLALQVACSIPPKRISWSPADSASCAGPCWHDLVIGKSNEEDVMSEIQTLAFINQDAIHRGQRTCCVPGDENNANPGSVILANCVQPASLCLEVGFSNNVLTGFRITPNDRVSLGEAIETLGDPDFAGYHIEGAETLICDINLVWSNKQLILTSRSYSGMFSGIENCDNFRNTRKVKRTLPITEVSYRTAPSLEYLFTREPSEYLKFTKSMLGE